jgi:NAD(P)-dependent dehydrogenase (short-subunit alcohol dehydrogenase family)
MSGRLEGRVVVVTGAGRGLGREYALLAGAHGASVVVNDLGGALDGDGGDATPAEEVVAEIRAAGGRAVANRCDVASEEGSQALIAAAVEEFGDVHVLINNAGNMRDRMLVNMSHEEWDAVTRVHLRGHFGTVKAAAAHWRAEAKAGHLTDRALVSTTSISGLRGTVGQANYVAAKAGLAMFAVTASRELARYGVRSYAVAPSARTRLTLSTPHAESNVGKAVAPGEFDYWHPGNVAPFVLWLATAECPLPSGSVYGVEGDRIQIYEIWPQVSELRAGRRWDFDALDAASKQLLEATPPPPDFALENIGVNP